MDSAPNSAGRAAAAARASDRRQPRPGSSTPRDETLRLVRALPRQRGPPDHRGLPRRRKDDAGQGARPLARLLVLAHPVHAGPAAHRRHRRERLRPALERVRFRPGPVFANIAARRRDQPRLAEDPGRAARVHAGEPGHRRRRQYALGAAVHGHRDAEPDRVRGHVPAARGAARPLRDAALARLSAARTRRRGCSRSRRARRRSTSSSRWRLRGAARASIEEAQASTSRRACTATSSRCCGDTRATRASTSAPARVRASRCCAWRRRARSPTAVSTCCPTTSRRSRRPCSRTG